jgi:succinate-semialdehyde dehydrogenase/glutarate-semialdehyde dehydrogenase
LFIEMRKTMSYQTVNPYTGEVTKEFRHHTDTEVDSAVAQADSCFAAWKQTTFSERTKILKSAARTLRSRSGEFATLITLEMGKLIAESRGEVALSADIIDYYADHAEEFLAPHAIPHTAGEATVVSSPLGVLFGVEPWNFPYYQLARLVAPDEGAMKGSAACRKSNSYEREVFATKRRG